jgi:hypothetical protein
MAHEILKWVAIVTGGLLLVIIVLALSGPRQRD